MIPRFVDTNVLVAYYSESETDHGQRSIRLLDRVFAGSEDVVVTATVVLETTFILTRKRDLPRTGVAEALTLLLALPNVACRDKGSVVEALERWRSTPALSFPDWFHLVMTRESESTEIYTFDQAMDRLPGVTRIEP